MAKLAIIGTAGRRDDGDRLTKDHWKRMLDKIPTVIGLIQAEHGIVIDRLVSGGAAWADHTAVSALPALALDLFLPCRFETSTHKFREGDFAAQEGWNIGKVINFYHRRFSERAGIDSLLELEQATGRPTCRTEVQLGFKTRNTAIAGAADAVLAMTFGNVNTVKPGGTSDTLTKFLARPDHGPAYHMDLNSGLCYRNAKP